MHCHTILKDLTLHDTNCFHRNTTRQSRHTPCSKEKESTRNDSQPVFLCFVKLISDMRRWNKKRIPANWTRLPWQRNAESLGSEEQRRNGPRTGGCEKVQGYEVVQHIFYANWWLMVAGGTNVVEYFSIQLGFFHTLEKKHEHFRAETIVSPTPGTCTYVQYVPSYRPMRTNKV